MRYVASLYQRPLGAPIGSISGADTASSRQAALEALADRYGYASWEAMTQDLPYTRRIELQPLSPECVGLETLLLEAALPVEDDVTDEEIERLSELARRAGYATLSEAISALLSGPWPEPDRTDTTLPDSPAPAATEVSSDG